MALTKAVLPVETICYGPATLLRNVPDGGWTRKIQRKRHPAAGSIRPSRPTHNTMFLRAFPLKSVPFVRHEVARVFIKETKDPVFCHRYRLGTGASDRRASRWFPLSC